MQQSQSAIAISPTYIWALQSIIMLVTFGITLFAVTAFIDSPIAPQAAQVVLGIGTVLCLPAILYNNKSKRNPRRAISTQNPQTQQEDHKLVKVVISASLAELPGFVGLAYYAMARELTGMAVLLMASVILMVWVRPK